MALKLDLVGTVQDRHSFTYDSRDVMLYALGVGAGPEELDYVFELRGPKVLPTFAVIPAFEPMLNAALAADASLLTLLHGEQAITLHAPIPPAGTLSTEAVITAIHDKGKGAVLHVECSTSDSQGNLLFENHSSLFCRGEGGFGGDPGPKAPSYDPPADVAPTFREEALTTAQQALLYRLSGDRNPLHADPDFAAKAGFDRPILHGLCTFGHLGRALLKHACGGDAARLKKLAVRFSGVVFPGDTLVSEGWDMGGGVYHVRVTTGRGTPAITNATAVVS